MGCCHSQSVVIHVGEGALPQIPLLSSPLSVFWAKQSRAQIMMCLTRDFKCGSCLCNSVGYTG